MNVVRLLEVLDKPLHTFSNTMTKLLVHALRPHVLYHHQFAGSLDGAVPIASPLPRSFMRIRSVAVIESLLTEYERPLPLSRLCALQQHGSLREQLELVLVDIARRLWLAKNKYFP